MSLKRILASLNLLSLLAKSVKERIGPVHDTLLDCSSFSLPLYCSRINRLREPWLSLGIGRQHRTKRRGRHGVNNPLPARYCNQCGKSFTVSLANILAGVVDARRRDGCRTIALTLQIVGAESTRTRTDPTASSTTTASIVAHVDFAHSIGGRRAGQAAVFVVCTEGRGTSGCILCFVLEDRCEQGIELCWVAGSSLFLRDCFRHETL